MLYKDAAGQVYDVNADGVQYLPADATPMSDQESQAHIAAQQQADALERNKIAATRALLDSDASVMQYYEAGQPLPAAWAAYRTTLRSIISTGAGLIPSSPPGP